jgi:hypothetical protein
MCGPLGLKDAHCIIILVGFTRSKGPTTGFISIIVIVCRERSAQGAFKPKLRQTPAVKRKIFQDFSPKEAVKMVSDRKLA